MKKKYRIRKYSPLWWIKQLAVPGIVLAILLAMCFMSEVAADESYAAETPEETEPTEVVIIEPEPASLGVFTITHYCRENYPHICNDGDSTETATGTAPTLGRTIAADPTILPYGTVVLIDGHEYVVEDCGEAIMGNRIDILVDTHAEAIELGIYKAEVFRKVEEYHGL